MTQISILPVLFTLDTTSSDCLPYWILIVEQPYHHEHVCLLTLAAYKNLPLSSMEAISNTSLHRGAYLYVLGSLSQHEPTHQCFQSLEVHWG